MSGEDDDESDDSLLREIARIDDDSVADAPEVARASGSRLGRFVVRGELGRGGMGIVYRADDEQLGRHVALKVLRDRKRSDPQRRARFLREARSAAALVHPRVATVYEIGETDGELYIAMELVSGESLRERLTRSGALPLNEALPIARGIARALAAAHAKGIVHRDLKPENVMLDAEGVPKVLDFGLAKFDELATPPREVLERQSTPAVLTEEGHVLGTPAYMSPEQAQGRAVDVRSDVFSFGIVLFEMLAGERPFKGESGMGMAIAIARDQPIDLARLKPGLPVWAVTLVATCLTKAPADRYASGRELCEALEGAGAQPAAKLRRGSRVWRAYAVVVVVVLVTAVAAASAIHQRSAASSTTTADAASSVDQDSGASRPRSLMSYPPPQTKNPEAAEAYASAMHDLRDLTAFSAQSDLVRAVKLDPTFAAAYLRLLWPWYQTGFSRADAQKQYSLAQQYRGALDGRERALLDVAEAFTHDPVDWKEAAARLRAVLAQYPDDVETLTELADVLSSAGELEASRAIFERVLRIDPDYAFALLAWAATYEAGDAATEATLLDRCLAVSPRAPACFEMRATLERESGRCAEYEATARTMVATSPTYIDGYLLLADAVACRGAPVEAVESLLDKASSLAIDQHREDPKSAAASENVALGLLAGDFPRAIAGATETERLRATVTSEGDHVDSTLTIITSLREEGRDDEALRVAEDFEKRLPAWSLNDGRVRRYLLFARRHAGKVDEATFRRQVEELGREDAAHEVAVDLPSSRFWVHVANADGSPVDLDVARPFLDAPLRSGHNEGIRGHVLFLAGHLDEAIPPLKTGAQTCEILPTGTGSGWQGLQAFSFMHSRLWLGEALEAKGDTAGACANYSVILERWKNAKPRSVTLEKARSRSRALHCAAPL